jgi:hypothetical protein
MRLFVVYAAAVMLCSAAVAQNNPDQSSARSGGGCPNDGANRSRERGAAGKHLLVIASPGPKMCRLGLNKIWE